MEKSFNLPALPLIDGALFLSASALETYAACPRAGQYYKINARVSAEPSSALVFGKHLHSALEIHYRMKEWNVLDVRERVANMLAAEFARTSVPEGDFRTLNWALEIYDQYAARFEFEKLGLMRYSKPQTCSHCKGKGCDWCNQEGKSSIMCEVPFALKLGDFHFRDGEPDIAVYYHGFVDLPIMLEGQLVVMDFKTTSMLGQSFWDDKRMSAQQVGYAWAIQNLTGQKVSGFVVRALRTSQMPNYIVNGKANRSGQNKSIESWWSEAFVEERFHLGDDELSEWYENTRQLVEQFLWHYRRGYFPQHKPTGCVHKHGRCQYYEVCNTFPASSRDLLLNSGLFKGKENGFETERL